VRRGSGVSVNVAVHRSASPAAGALAQLKVTTPSVVSRTSKVAARGAPQPVAAPMRVALARS
jgi:hypothetical protein